MEEIAFCIIFKTTLSPDKRMLYKLFCIFLESEIKSSFLFQLEEIIFYHLEWLQSFFLAGDV